MGTRLARKDLALLLGGSTPASRANRVVSSLPCTRSSNDRLVSSSFATRSSRECFESSRAGGFRSSLSEVDEGKASSKSGASILKAASATSASCVTCSSSWSSSCSSDFTAERRLMPAAEWPSMSLKSRSNHLLSSMGYDDSSLWFTQVELQASLVWAFHGGRVEIAQYRGVLGEQKETAKSSLALVSMEARSCLQKPRVLSSG
jgi:hypothetical protein